MRFNQEVKKWATDLHIFLHKAEQHLPQCDAPDEFIAEVFNSFEEKPQFLSERPISPWVSQNTIYHGIRTLGLMKEQEGIVTILRRVVKLDKS